MTKNKVPHCHDLCTDTISAYVWGADLSGAIHGAGGVGGLLAVKRDGAWYVPLYDANGHQKSAKPKGNPLGDRDFIAVPKGRSEERYPATQRQLYVTAYVSETGAVVAEYEYDAFGATIAQSGAMADAFRHRFSTKPWIAALGAYDYGERLYSPGLRRWMSRDPIEEEGGVNLYAMCGNDAVNGVDPFGLKKVIKNCCTDEDIRAKLTEKLLEADRLSYSNAIRIVIHGTGIYKRNSQTYKYYREYSGYICCKDGKVSSTGPYPGAYRFNIGGVEREIEDTKELKKYLAKVEIGSISMGGIPTSGNVELNAKCQCPKGSKAIVFYHTHPEPNSFSASDRQWFRSGRRIGFALYSHGLDYIELAEWGNPLIRIPLKTKGL